MKKWTLDILINEFNETHNNKYDYTAIVEYYSQNHKYTIICPVHGEFQQSAYSHLKGSKCPKCAKLSANAKLRDSLSNFVNQAKVVHDNKYNYNTITEYVNRHTIYNITCPEHGIFHQSASHHLAGRGCPKCRYDTLSVNNRKLISLNCAKANLDAAIKNKNIQLLHIQHDENLFTWCGAEITLFCTQHKKKYIRDYNYIISNHLPHFCRECAAENHAGYYAKMLQCNPEKLKALPGVLYIVQDPNNHLYVKIGVSKNSTKTRYQTTKINILHEYQFDTLYEAVFIEQTLINNLKSHTHNDQVNSAFGAGTECFNKSCLSDNKLFNDVDNKMFIDAWLNNPLIRATSLAS